MNKQRLNYYANPNVIAFLSDFLLNREGVFLKKVEDDKKYLETIRCLKMFSPRFLLMNMDKFEFGNRDYNLYYSLSSYRNLPVMSYNIKQRLLQQRSYNKELDDDYNADKNYLITGYDFSIDIDSDNMMEALIPATKVKKIFDEFKIPYQLKASGNQGFHFNIPSAYWLESSTIKEKYETNLNVARNFKVAHNIEEVDLKGIYSYRRIWKMPLSYDVVSDMIAVPLDDKMFKEFKYHYCSPDYVLANTNLFKQDLFIRRHGLQYPELKENVKAFVKEYATN